VSKNIAKLRECAVCHQDKPISSNYGNTEVCGECVSWYADYTCDICHKVIGIVGAYEEHLRNAHTLEELAIIVAAKAKKEKEQLRV